LFEYSYKVKYYGGLNLHLKFNRY